MIRAVVVSLSIIGAMGCSEATPVVSSAVIEEGVAGSVAEALAPTPVVGLSCPDMASVATADAGTVTGFECQATVSGDPVVLDLRLVREIDDTVGVDVEVVTPLLDVDDAAAVAQERLAADLGGDPAVVCAESRVVIAPGREIGCRVTADGGTAGPVDRAMVLRILDTDGVWEVDLLP